MDDYWSTPSSTSFTYPRQTARRCRDKFGRSHYCPGKDILGPLVGVFIGLLVLIVCLGCFVRRKRRKVMETDTSPSAVEVDQPPPAYTPREPNSDTGQAQRSNMEMQRPANVFRSGTSW
ncbi:hypothetical protein I7I48_09976 [Histoplasma ohiense]|nr:hypothetical protein I7I48_09976 [Histoplasma ohiense (nom. inval.)]